MNAEFHPETKPNKKETPGVMTVRERIVAGSRRQFFTYGLRAVPMDELAAALGMSKKTVYTYFPSKIALVKAAILDKFQEVEAELEIITSEIQSDYMAVLHRYLACVQRHMDEIQPPFHRDIQREAPGIFEIIEARRKAIIQRYLGRILVEGRSSGVIRDDIPVEIMIEILLGAVQTIMNPSQIAKLGLTPKSGFLAIISAFFRGILTEKGRSRI